MIEALLNSVPGQMILGDLRVYVALLAGAIVTLRLAAHGRRAR